ncbi:hypothetical protein HDV05_007723 [Chytridiales sp. JEL 0842]|nr:hypothetical protein HDV05_007723 [Chytridiales sp. JEL 0842]
MLQDQQRSTYVLAKLLLRQLNKIAQSLLKQYVVDIGLIVPHDSNTLGHLRIGNEVMLNEDEKTLSDLLRELKISLFHLFSNHGEIIDIVAKKGKSMRGQAFVVFKAVQDATAAMRALQGFPFMGKAIKLEYARTKSNAVFVVEGRVVPAQRQKPPAAPTPVAAGQKRSRDQEDDGVDRKRVAIDKAEAADDDDDDMDMEDDEEEEEIENKILYLIDLPEEVTESDAVLIKLFEQYSGFKEVRVIAGKKAAFVEYDTVANASEARKRLNGFQLTPKLTLKIHFAKM